MKIRNHLHALLFVSGLITIAFAGCSKKDDSGPSNNSKKVKYEITGTYTGKFTVLISDNTSGTATISDVALPWSKEISYGSDVIAVGLGASATTDGAAGQTVFLKILVNGNVVKQSNATAGSGGGITIPAIGHSF